MMSSGLALSMTVLPLLAAAVLGENENYEAAQTLFATSSAIGTVLACGMMWTEMRTREDTSDHSEESDSEVTNDSNTTQSR